MNYPGREPIPPSHQFELGEASASQIVDQYRELTDAWFDTRFTEEYEVPGTNPHLQRLNAFARALQPVVRDHTELARDLTDRLFAANSDEGDGFTDQMLASDVAVELTRHDQERGIAIWVRGLASQHFEISGPARARLHNAIKDQQLPAETLALVAFRAASLLGEVSGQVPQARELLDRMTNTGPRT